MNYRPFVMLFGSCAIAMLMAIAGFNFGLGFLSALLIYSLVGTFLLVASSLIAYWSMDDEEEFVAADTADTDNRFVQA